MSLLCPSGTTCVSSNGSRHTSMKTWQDVALWRRNGSLPMRLSTTMLVCVCWNCAKGEEHGKTLWTKKLTMTLLIKLLLLARFLKQGSLLRLSQGFIQGSHSRHLGIETLLLISLPLPFPNPQQPPIVVTEGAASTLPPRRSSCLRKSTLDPLGNVQSWKGKTHFAPSSLLATAIDKVCGLTPSSACMLQTQIHGYDPVTGYQEHLPPGIPQSAIALKAKASFDPDLPTL